jgi:hypothetical protein
MTSPARVDHGVPGTMTACLYDDDPQCFQTEFIFGYVVLDERSKWEGVDIYVNNVSTTNVHLRSCAARWGDEAEGPLLIPFDDLSEWPPIPTGARGHQRHGQRRDLPLKPRP